jgi:flavin reductase (DIM6/NTAB) family NADH-FMN oxidoreductase RutF
VTENASSAEADLEARRDLRASSAPGKAADEVDAKIRRKTLRLLSNGVYVLTSRGGDRLGAATVTWVSQVSFRPPLVMVAVRPESNVFKCMMESRVAVLHIVGDKQQEIARRFFHPTAPGPGTINGEPFAEGRTSAPVLVGFPAHMECRLERVVEANGDHAVMILEVLGAECRERVRPLTIADSPWEYGG